MIIEDCCGKKIHWGMTPQEAIIVGEIKTQEDLERIQQKVRSMAGAYFYINVWNCQVQLSLMQMNETVTGRSERIGQVLITDEELEQAICAQGGAINMSGHYAMPLPLQERIKTYLGEGVVECSRCGRAFRIPQEACRELSAVDIRAGKWLRADCSEDE